MMQKFYLYFMAAVAGLLFVAHSYGAPVTINGYTFSDNSATLTHPYFPTTLGDEFPFEVISGINEGQTYSLEADAVEEVYGVQCLRVSLTDTRWLAQDTNGNIHLFKLLLGNGHSFEVDEDADIPCIFLPASFSMGDSWEYQLENDEGIEGERYTIVSMSYSISPYFADAIRARQEWLSPDSIDELDHYIFKENDGWIGREVENELVAVRSNLLSDDTSSSGGGGGGGGGCFISTLSKF